MPTRGRQEGFSLAGGPAFLFLFWATSVASPRLLSPYSVLPPGPSFGSFPFPAPFSDPQLRLASLATLPPPPPRAL